MTQLQADPIKFDLVLLICNINPLTLLRSGLLLASSSAVQGFFHHSHSLSSSENSITKKIQ